MRLILDLREENYDPLKNKAPFHIKYEYFEFKGGEPHIKIKPFGYADDTVYEVRIRLTSFKAIGKLIIATDALKRMTTEQGRRTNTQQFVLKIDYFPGARQDRIMIPGEPFTAKIYADLINNLEYDIVAIVDAHSDVTPALLNNCLNLDNHSFIRRVLMHLYPKKDSAEFYLISPDAGSNKKIGSLAKYLNHYTRIKIIKCDKERDVSTGEIKSFEVYADDLKGKDCLIVDDICDGGGTFLGLAAELKKKNAGKLYLAVSHGIFSNGFKSLNDVFKMIYTTNSFKNYDETWHEGHHHYQGYNAKLKQL